MALAKHDIEFIKAHLAQWMVEQSVGKPLAVYEIELRERMVRVEEALRHQGELIQTLIGQMDKRFEQIDKRFEQVEKRFEQIDKRFEQMDERFEQVDKRFEQVEKRFEQVDKRFEAITQRIDRFMIWSFGITMASAGVVIGVLRLWPPGAS